MNEACQLFLVPSRSSNTPLYPSKCCELGSMLRLLLFRCFLLGLTFEPFKELGVRHLVGVPRLWTTTAPRPELGSRRVLNQSYSSCRKLFNAVSHSSRRHQEEVDSQLLVVGSQIANLTPGPSFAHNLGCRCPNGQCKAIFDIYVSRPFQ